jgi:hypothetical protein
MTWARRDPRLTLRNAGFRDQIATLAAAISGVPKEGIEGEDVRQQRKTRRIVRAVIATLSVLVLLASALAVLFYGERQTAIRQRQEAVTERQKSVTERAIADESGRAELWDIGFLVDVLARLCSQVGGSLTHDEWAHYVPLGPAYRNVCAQHS